MVLSQDLCNTNWNWLMVCVLVGIWCNCKLQCQVHQILRYSTLFRTCSMASAEQKVESWNDLFCYFSSKMDIGGALRDVLVEANLQGRLTCGVYKSSKMLEMWVHFPTYTLLRISIKNRQQFSLLFWTVWSCFCTQCKSVVASFCDLCALDSEVMILFCSQESRRSDAVHSSRERHRRCHSPYPLHTHWSILLGKRHQAYQGRNRILYTSECTKNTRGKDHDNVQVVVPFWDFYEQKVWVGMQKDNGKSQYTGSLFGNVWPQTRRCFSPENVSNRLDMFWFCHGVLRLLYKY